MPDRGSPTLTAFGGIVTFGLQTGAIPIRGCFMCPDNNMLAFRPVTVPGIDGYVVPGSMPVAIEDRTELVPMPFTALVVPFVHPGVDFRGYGRTLPTNWEDMLDGLIPAIEGLEPGMPWSNHSQIGFEAGARIPPAVTESGAPGHGWEWVCWARNLLAEGGVESTKYLGQATIIHHARQNAGSLPSDAELYVLWTVCQRVANPLTRYHRELLRLAA